MALPDILHLLVSDSGHGGNMPDQNGDESDGKDETLVPLDYQRCVLQKKKSLVPLIARGVCQGLGKDGPARSRRCKGGMGRGGCR